jgi:CRP-like cAMP-binding protein
MNKLNININNISLRDVSLFQGFTPKELEYIQASVIEKSFKKDDVIFFSGDPCRGILILRSGRIKLSCLSASGKEQVLETFQCGQTCACHTESIAQCPGNVQAAADCVVWFLPIEKYEQLIKAHPRMLKKLNTILASRLCHFSDLIKRISLDAPQERLAQFILDSAEKKQKFPQYPNFTHDEIAQRVGLTRETVTRYLNKFKRSKLIAVKSQEISVLNLEKLQKLAS